MKLVHVVRS